MDGGLTDTSEAGLFTLRGRSGDRTLVPRADISRTRGAWLRRSLETSTTPAEHATVQACRRLAGRSPDD